MNLTVLIVEDETLVAMEMSRRVEKFGYNVVAIVNNANDAYAKALEHRPGIIMMDINIKGAIDGVQAALNILSQYHCSIIYLTAYNDEETIERAVATKPSAFLTKPYKQKELLAAIKIAHIHAQQETHTLHVKCGDIIFNDEFSYDTHASHLLYCGEYIHLTTHEHKLLTLLLQAKGSLVSIYDIENTIWPNKAPKESTRRALVSRLRAKLKHQFIETTVGSGYRFIF
jgi:DNA-binding response OmpR family regulator